MPKERETIRQREEGYVGIREATPDRSGHDVLQSGGAPEPEAQEIPQEEV
jgi:hypothetical protein